MRARTQFLSSDAAKNMLGTCNQQRDRIEDRGQRQNHDSIPAAAHQQSRSQFREHPNQQYNHQFVCLFVQLFDDLFEMLFEILFGDMGDFPALIFGTSGIGLHEKVKDELLGKHITEQMMADTVKLLAAEAMRLKVESPRNLQQLPYTKQARGL